MRRSQRLIAAVVLISLSGVLAGCSDSLSNWDPTDLLDFLDTKKKIPGDRKPVFPEGVPGLEQGVPKRAVQGLGAGTARSTERPGCCGGLGPCRGAEIEALEIEEHTTGRGSGCRVSGRRWCQRGAACSQAQENCAQAHHRAAAGSANGAAGAARATGQPQQSAAPFPAPMPSGTFTR